jgi:hypothetical protein
MQEASFLDRKALHSVLFDQRERPGDEWGKLHCKDPGVNLPLIPTANESSS